MITIATTTRIRHPDYPPERGMPGALSRLLSEPWETMTAAANRSPNHVKSQERWIAKAREANPGLSDEQAARLGEMLRTEHYKRMGRLSAQARKLAREAQAELEQGIDADSSPESRRVRPESPESVA